jgi:hypothetical protein
MRIAKLLFLMYIFFSMSSVFAQNNEKQNWPKIEFETMVYDFGEIPYNSAGDHDFIFKNIGKGPLVINKVQSS